MTSHDDYRRDFVQEASDPQVTRLIADLETMFSTTPPADLRASIVHTIAARSAERTARRPLWPAWRRRVVAFTGTLALVLGGGVAYLAHHGVEPVSAQTILRRAVVASHLAADQVAHLTYTLYPRVPGRGSGLAGPLDLWLQTDAHGATSRSAGTMTIYKAGAVAVVMRVVLTGGTIQSYTYDANADEIAISPAISESTQLSSAGNAPFFFDPLSVEANLLKIAQTAPEQARLLPQQTLDGVRVDVVQITGDPQQDQPPTIAYFDAQTYLLRGLDETESASMTVRWRVTGYSVVAADAVPPHTFDLNAPASAHIVPNVEIPEFVPGD